MQNSDLLPSTPANVADSLPLFADKQKKKSQQN